jgi:hypothetical protein
MEPQRYRGNYTTVSKFLGAYDQPLTMRLSLEAANWISSHFPSLRSMTLCEADGITFDPQAASITVARLSHWVLDKFVSSHHYYNRRRRSFHTASHRAGALPSAQCAVGITRNNRHFSNSISVAASIRVYICTSFDGPARQI